MYTHTYSQTYSTNHAVIIVSMKECKDDERDSLMRLLEAEHDKAPWSWFEGPVQHMLHIYTTFQTTSSDSLLFMFYLLPMGELIHIVAAVSE